MMKMLLKEGIPIMKKLWDIKTYVCFFILVLLLQLLPFLFIGEWWLMILYYVTFPFGEITEKILEGKLVQVSFSVIASSFVWTLTFIGIIKVFRLMKNFFYK